MIPLQRWKSVVTVTLMLAAVLAISACGSVQSKDAASAKAAGDFDVVVQTYKSGQFLLNGAIVSPLDLSSHFAYLRDQHRLPKTVLLERSEKQEIHKEHLRDMASMALTYGFTVYYSDGGKLRRIVPNVKNKVQLKDAPPPTENPTHPRIDQYDATHSGTGRGRGRGR